MTFALEIEPLPQCRPRFSRGHCYEPARITSYKDAVAEAARTAMAGAPPLTGAVEVQIRFSRKFSVTSRRFGDLDNLAKSVIDALNGVIWLDDAQIVKLELEKIQAPTTFLEVHINECT